ncbi:putative membrane chloride channel (bestrophin family) [Lysobacter sp. OAE881]|nr:hypothetical protein [Lysobacter soli]MDG2519387.1 hypothetical protein [Lysobacter soli]
MEASENLFDGGANGVPVWRICQDIQIDLREMLGEVDVPAPSRRVSDIAL